MLRYHSFYAAHRHGAYRHLMNQHDERMFEWVRKLIPTICTRRAASGPKCKTFFPTTRNWSQTSSLTKLPGD